MEIIRLLNIKHFYDRRPRRFNSLAFKNSSGPNPGITVISRDCIRNLGNTLCNHVSTFYNPRGNQLFLGVLIQVYYHQVGRLNTKIARLEIVAITTLQDSVAKRFFKQYENIIESFRICEPGGRNRTLTREDVEKLVLAISKQF